MDRFGINEILSTVLLNFVSFGIVDYVACEVWSDPAAGHPTTIPIGDGGLLPLVGGRRCTRRAARGARLRWPSSSSCAAACRATSSGPWAPTPGRPRSTASGSAGSPSGRSVVGGALAGLAGAIEVAGVHGKLIEGMQSNYLLLGIIIGLIARGNALAVPFVAFGIAVLEVGSSAMQRSAGVPSEMVLIVEALILLFLLFSDVVGARLRRSSR